MRGLIYFPSMGLVDKGPVMRKVWPWNYVIISLFDTIGHLHVERYLGTKHMAISIDRVVWISSIIIKNSSGISKTYTFTGSNVIQWENKHIRLIWNTVYLYFFYLQLPSANLSCKQQVNMNTSWRKVNWLKTKADWMSFSKLSVVR